MTSSETLTVRNGTGKSRSFEIVPPNRWTGESDCLVGPFVSKEIAEHFSNVGVDFGHFEIYLERVRAIEGTWYVEIHDLQA